MAPSVKGQLSAARTKRQRLPSPFVREKVQRILERALPLIADAAGCTPQQVQHFIKITRLRFVVASNEVPEIIAAPEPSEPEPIPAFIKPHQEPADMTPRPAVRMVKSQPVPTGQCHLKNKDTGAYLHWSGQSMTMEKAHRWKGTAAQAKKCRDVYPLARQLTLVTAAMPIINNGVRP